MGGTSVAVLYTTMTGSLLDETDAAAAARWNARDLYTQFSRNVFARALTLLGREDAAKDAMQEVFLRVLSGDGKILKEPKPMGWLYRVTTNLCLNRLRDDRNRTVLLARNIKGQINNPATEAQVVVRNLLRSLPPDLQLMAVCYYVDEMTRDEIADLTGVSRRTVGNRLLAFRAALAYKDESERGQNQAA